MKFFIRSILIFARMKFPFLTVHENVRLRRLPYYAGKIMSSSIYYNIHYCAIRDHISQ